MPFNDAIAFVTKNATDTATRLEKLQRPRWFLTDAKSIPDLIKKFDTEDENKKWEELTKDPKKSPPDINKLIGVRERIAWLTGYRIGLRRQFASGLGDTPRSQLERQRYTQFQHLLRQRVLERLKEIQTVERTKPITQS